MHRIILLLLVFNLVILSQNSDSANHIQDSILKKSEKNFYKTAKSKDAIFISLKGGYHTLNYDFEGLKSAWIAGLSLGAEFNRHWVLGIAFDYSASTDYYHYRYGSEALYVNKMEEYGVSMIFKYKFSFFRDKVDINAGIGLGTYTFKETNHEGNNKGTGYLNASINSGIGVKIYNNLSVNFEWSVYRLLIMSENHRLLSINNFKIGPTIHLYY